MNSRRRAARASRVANPSQRRSTHSKPTAAHSKSRSASGRRVGILAQRRCPPLGRTPLSLARVSRPSPRGSTRTPRRRGLVEGVVLDGLLPVRRGGAKGTGELGGPTKEVQRSNRVPRWTRAGRARREPCRTAHVRANGDLHGAVVEQEHLRVLRARVLRDVQSARLPFRARECTLHRCKVPTR